MSFVTIWIHAVWGTKNREPLLLKPVRDSICQHILENAAGKGIHIDLINGHTEHLHCLMKLSVDLSISKQMQLIKGESSFWANKNKLITGNFEWANEYYAASVSERQLNRVREYIRNQEAHHRKVTFTDECDGFLRDFELGRG
jgi:REP element-mobilizing transposase RayT